jgi:hypothetical protein
LNAVIIHVGAKRCAAQRNGKNETRIPFSLFSQRIKIASSVRAISRVSDLSLSFCYKLSGSNDFTFGYIINLAPTGSFTNRKIQNFNEMKIKFKKRKEKKKKEKLFLCHSSSRKSQKSARQSIVPLFVKERYSVRVGLHLYSFFFS